jgi:hypothetical protein
MVLEETNSAGDLIWACILQNCEKIHFCYLSPLFYDFLLWQLWQTNTENSWKDEGYFVLSMVFFSYSQRIFSGILMKKTVLHACCCTAGERMHRCFNLNTWKARREREHSRGRQVMIHVN